jgi:RNA polymerase sigma-70 factor (ECF subfamily)
MRADRGVSRGVAAAEFDLLYHAHYADVVAMLHALTGDLGEAQDLAQESFCRAWQRWGSLAAYDNPVAWVRRVAVNLANSRWRHRRAADRYLRRQRSADVPPLLPDHVAVVAALRHLPGNHRTALVLHHMLDLTVADVALEMGVPAGTVKAWLSRGRAALAAALVDPDESEPDLSVDADQADAPKEATAP